MVRSPHEADDFPGAALRYAVKLGSLQEQSRIHARFGNPYLVFLATRDDRNHHDCLLYLCIPRQMHAGSL